MTAKAALVFMDSEAVGPPPVTERDVDTTAFSSGVLYVESDASNTGVMSFDLQEVNPVTGRTTGFQPLGSSQNISPGHLFRFRINDLVAARYRFTAYSQSSGPGVITAVLVVVTV